MNGKGIMKQDMIMLIPVKAFEATAPPKTSLAVTMELVNNAKIKNIL